MRRRMLPLDYFDYDIRLTPRASSAADFRLVITAVFRAAFF